VKEVLALVESGALTLRVPANTDIERSAIKVTLSNTLLSGIESIISSLAEYPHGCIEQSTSTTFPNAILLRFSRVFQSVVKDPSVIQKNLSAGIERIRGMQQPDGGFAYWPGEVGSNLHITPYVLRTLILMKQSGVDVPDVMIGSAKQYLENSLDMLTDDTERAEAYWSLALAKSKKANVLKDKIDVAKLRTHGKVAYLYGLFLSENITNKTMLAALLNPKSVSQNDDYYYWTADSDRAILGSLLIDIKAPREKIDAIVGALYKKDYMSYWYSTQEKNNAFYLFSKYIEVYGSENVSSVTFDGLGRSETIALGASDPNYVTITFTGLADKVNHGEFPFSFSQTGTSPVYVTIEGSFYPKDLKQIPSQDTMGVSIKRIIYAVDEDMGGIVSGEIKLKPHTTDTFKHNALYKVRLEIAVDQNVSQNRQNFAIEDYIPASFRVINNAFLTNASIYDENTKKEWWWGYQQILKDMVFLSNQYDIPAFYEYFFRPEIKGTFIYPPATGYFMYSPSVEGHTGYRVIRVE
jgi:uncharacterized protein YfaS (alpha-2-macroglobulin family)